MSYFLIRWACYIQMCNFKAPYAYGYDVNEYDEYGNPKVFSKHEERDDYGNLKGKTVTYRRTTGKFGVWTNSQTR